MQFEPVLPVKHLDERGVSEVRQVAETALTPSKRQLGGLPTAEQVPAISNDRLELTGPNHIREPHYVRLNPEIWICKPVDWMAWLRSANNGFDGFLEYVEF